MSVCPIQSCFPFQEGSKLRRARQAVTSFIEDGLHDDVSLGVVSFSHQAKLISPVQKLQTQQERRSISDRLPTGGEGATSLGAAVLKALEVSDLKIDTKDAMRKKARLDLRKRGSGRKMK